MTDDRIVRMLRVSESDPVQQDAADEIERLRAELAAEREAHEILLAERNMRHFQMTQAVRAERDALRAELAAEQGIKCETLRMLEHVTMERDAALRDAEDLNVEVEHYANLAIVDLGANPTVSWNERAEAAEAERDALRALLREARKLIARCDPQDFFNMLASIDAALKKGGGDE